MIDDVAAATAIQTRLIATVVATTGSATLSATTTGYARASGSFLTDGFVAGLEITPAGFPANAAAVVNTVSALALPTVGTHGAAVAASGRSLVAKLPARRAFDMPLEPVADELSMRGEYVPTTNDTITMAPNNGRADEAGLYFVTLFAPTHFGPDVLRRMAKAALAQFASGTLITAGAHTLRVPHKPGPRGSQVLPHSTAGVSFVQLTIPWGAPSRNAVLA